MVLRCLNQQQPSCSIKVKTKEQRTINTVMIQTIRSLLFASYYTLTTTIFSLLGLILAWVLPFRWLFNLLGAWNHSVIQGVRFICGINYRIVGQEHIPKHGAYVVLANHQSPWETFFLMVLFKQPISIVCKKELLLIPGFGWCLAMLKPITINRSNPKDALRKIQAVGKHRLTQDHMPVLIFPEGTRVNPNETKPYARSGAELALNAQVPVIFVSHNAGKYWPSEGLIKKPGTITMHISPMYHPTANDTSKTLTLKAKTWITSQSL